MGQVSNTQYAVPTGPFLLAVLLRPIDHRHLLIHQTLKSWCSPIAVASVAARWPPLTCPRQPYQSIVDKIRSPREDGRARERNHDRVDHHMTRCEEAGELPEIFMDQSWEFVVLTGNLRQLGEKRRAVSGRCTFSVIEDPAHEN